MKRKLLQMYIQLELAIFQSYKYCADSSWLVMKNNKMFQTRELELMALRKEIQRRKSTKIKSIDLLGIVLYYPYYGQINKKQSKVQNQIH